MHDAYPSKKASDRTSHYVATAVAAIASLLFVVRGLPRLREASLFAEDGQIFLTEAHNDGIAAFVAPYAGYLHTIPRLIAAIFEPLPVTALPVAYCCAAIVVHLLFLTPALSARLSWLLPSPLLRAGLFATLCLMPPLWEPYGNIANLIFVAGLCLLLLVISEDPKTKSGRLIEMVSVALIGLSGPLIVLFLPSFLWRWWRNGRTRHSLVVAATAGVTAAIQLSVYLASERSTPGGGTLVLLAKTAAERVGGGWLYGDSNVVAAASSSIPTILACVWLAAVLVVSLVAVPRTALPLWVLFAILLYSAVNAYGSAMVSSSFAFQRHVLIPTAVTLVLLWSVLGSSARTAIKAVAALCLVVGIGAVLHDFFPDPYPYRPSLSGLQECVDAGGKLCHQGIFGDGWSVDLQG
ncbi:hypothetical protein [Rhodococcus sp. 1168]|uniref:hypothetical protein n=1 Tax=Rhodococcus sp. 1168 TaxID=2018041 RepID=UPI000A0D2AA7|nr:hypothetical protein [Rhodococcus sp. 1168]ORI23732.1 hypothetical protein BJI47_01190 [Rhodococcus sp. 1168]